MSSIQVTFRDIPYSAALETQIHEHAEKLNEFFDGFTHCRVVLTTPQKHQHQGKIYNVRINLAVPGKEIVVTHQEHEDVYIAIRDAFNALSRQLEDYVRKKRGDVKTHSIPAYGNILRIFPDEGFGFIKGQDENEYYFNMTHLASTRFDSLKIGDAVHFLSEPVDDGLQARRVTKVKDTNNKEE